MNLPSIRKASEFLREAGDFIKIRKTKTNRIVATAKTGDIKLSRIIYPNGRTVDIKSYFPK